MKTIPEPLEMPRRLETLHGYVQSMCPDSGTVRDMLADGRWPCPACFGRGWDYDPNDRPCPIEGNKMRNRITCPECEGAGTGSRIPWVDLWERRRDRFLDVAAAHEAQRAMMCQALAKLTPEEAAALGWEKPE